MTEPGVGVSPREIPVALGRAGSHKHLGRHRWLTSLTTPRRAAPTQSAASGRRAAAFRLAEKRTTDTLIAAQVPPVVATTMIRITGSLHCTPSVYDEIRVVTRSFTPISPVRRIGAAGRSRAFANRGGRRDALALRQGGCFVWGAHFDWGSAMDEFRGITHMSESSWRPVGQSGRGSSPCSAC